MDSVQKSSQQGLFSQCLHGTCQIVRAGRVYPQPIRSDFGPAKKQLQGAIFALNVLNVF